MTSPDPAEVIPVYRARTVRDTRGQRLRHDEYLSQATPRTFAARLTARDRWLLWMLAEHRVLTTGQVVQLAFGSRRQATGRLRVLHQLRVVDRFRPYAPVGSAPLHYVLAPLGARVVAADHGTTVEAIVHRPENLARLAVSLQLAHDVGANGVFTALAAQGRAAGASGELTVWWSEARCRAIWDGAVRPDGYGRWRPADGTRVRGVRGEVDFFLEYDTGTENLDRIVAKLTGYARLAAASGLITPILFWLPHTRRELALHRAAGAWLAANPATAPLIPIATSHAGLSQASTSTGPLGPADAVWLARLGADPARPSQPRAILAQLHPANDPTAPPAAVATVPALEPSTAAPVAAMLGAPDPRPPQDPRAQGAGPAPSPVAWTA
jgi:hypothetical protein